MDQDQAIAADFGALLFIWAFKENRAAGCNLSYVSLETGRRSETEKFRTAL